MCGYLELGQATLRESFSVALRPDGNEIVQLNAVIHESLRTDGPANSSLERDVGPGGIVIDDTFIPEGTTIAAQGYTIHRNPEVFPQPDTWMPERWITDDLDQKKLMLSNFMPFGFSSRICAGQMLGKLLTRLVCVS